LGINGVCISSELKIANSTMYAGQSLSSNNMVDIAATCTNPSFKRQHTDSDYVTLLLTPCRVIFTRTQSKMFLDNFIIF